MEKPERVLRSPKKAEEEVQRPKLVLGILKRTCLTPYSKEQNWNSPAGLAKSQIVGVVQRIPLKHHPPS